MARNSFFNIFIIKFYARQYKCSELEVANDIEEKLEIIKNIYSIIENDIILLRKEIITQELYIQYKSLFFKPYHIISKEEIDILENIREIKELVDFSNVSKNEIEYIVKKINELDYTSKELIDVVEMLDPSVTNSIKEKDLINSFFDKLQINSNNIIELSNKILKVLLYKLRNLICEDSYIWIVESKEVYEIVRNILPDPSDQAQLTKMRNKYLKNKRPAIAY